MTNPIYLDAHLWDELLNQNVSIEQLSSDLINQGARLALSEHIVHELAKTFANKPAHAQNLFMIVKEALASNAVVMNDMDQLGIEVDAVRQGIPIRSLLEGTKLAELSAEVTNLAQGIGPDTARLTRSAAWDTFSAQAREGHKAHFLQRTDVKNRLKTIEEQDLANWLDAEILPPSGPPLLAARLEALYGNTLDRVTAEVLSTALLRDSRFRVARALVRATLYSNWRSANRGSLPRDLVPDLYHALQANYCSVYATAEKAQSRYAEFVLTNATRIAIYDKAVPIGTWLTNIPI